MADQRDARGELIRASLPLGGGFLGVALFFLFLLVLQKAIFAGVNLPGLRAADHAAVADALWRGLRFDAAALGLVLAPALLLYWVAAASRWAALRAIFLGYALFLSLAVSVISLADLQYFEEAGAHLTYEATSYLNLSIVPIVAGALAVRPYLTAASVVICAGLLWLTARVVGGLVRFGLPAPGERALAPSLLALSLWIPILIVAARGGTQSEAVRIGDCRISTSPYVNALCLDPVFSVLWSAMEPSRPAYRFYDEASNVGVVRRLVLGGAEEPLSREYPLLRRSAGSPSGNRKNVVLFILESWTARHVGAFGGRPDATPFFDALAGQGALFDQFFANGLRTPEGIFSILTAFPNQPLQRILGRARSYLVRWRTLSEILAEAGYDTIFVHGRDLDFDGLRGFLKVSRFERIVDRHQFPPTAPPRSGSWPGYDDEEVMRRAHQEFSQVQGRPFLGVVYTMNTHQPFMTPDGYPPLVPPTSDLARFLNALHYSDYTLRVFFDLARLAPYFRDTIFVLVADHSLTRESFNLANQHHIPLLIYAPGVVAPSRRSVVGSQLDLVPTLLGLLDLGVLHASWGQDLLRIPAERGFAVSAAGGQVRWRDRRYLVDDGLANAPPLLCELPADSTCRADAGPAHPGVREALTAELRAYVSLSQTLMYEDRVYPRRASAAAERGQDGGTPAPAPPRIGDNAAANRGGRTPR